MCTGSATLAALLKPNATPNPPPRAQVHPPRNPTNINSGLNIRLESLLKWSTILFPKHAQSFVYLRLRRKDKIWAAPILPMTEAWKRPLYSLGMPRGRWDYPDVRIILEILYWRIAPLTLHVSIWGLNGSPEGGPQDRSPFFFFLFLSSGRIFLLQFSIIQLVREVLFDA